MPWERTLYDLRFPTRICTDGDVALYLICNFVAPVAHIFVCLMCQCAIVRSTFTQEAVSAKPQTLNKSRVDLSVFRGKLGEETPRSPLRTDRAQTLSLRMFRNAIISGKTRGLTQENATHPCIGGARGREEELQCSGRGGYFENDAAHGEGNRSCSVGVEFHSIFPLG